MTEGQLTLPQLRFRFVGDWVAIDLDDPRGPATKDFLRSVIGREDELATVRAVARDSLSEAAEIASSSGARAMFVSSEIQPGLPMPVTMTVYDPAMRMTPSIGTGADAVYDVLLESFIALDVEGIETATRIDLVDSAVLRLHRIDIETRDDVEGLSVRSLIADYWYTVPGTKHVVLVNFLTPMGDIPNIMLTYFDSLVRASYFAAE